MNFFLEILLSALISKLSFAAFNNKISTEIRSFIFRICVIEQHIFIPITRRCFIRSNTALF